MTELERQKLIVEDLINGYEQELLAYCEFMEKFHVKQLPSNWKTIGQAASDALKTALQAKDNAE